MKKHSFAYIFVTTVTTLSLCQSTLVQAADEVKEKDQKIETIEKQTSDAQQDLSKITDKIKSNEEKSGKILKDIQSTQTKLDDLTIENQKLTKRIHKREGQLKEQARAVQVNGSSSNYLNFLLNADSLSDVLNRAQTVMTLVSANQSIVKEQIEDQATVADNKKSVEQEQKAQKAQIAELDKLQNDLTAQKLEKEKSVTDLALAKATAKEDRDRLIQKRNELKQKMDNSKVVSVNKKENNSAASTRSIEPTNGGGSSAPVGGGQYGMPVNAGVSSPYGPRSGLDSSGFHKGIDFGASYGQDIYASKDGQVVVAQQDGMPVQGYGMAIIIAHPDGTWTLYGHQSAMLVQVGQSVTRGQVIGKVGSSGQSTGAHLHFEIRTSLYGGIGNVLDPGPLLGIY